MQKEPQQSQNDATFVTTTDETQKDLSPRNTYVITKGANVGDGPNSTFNVNLPNGNTKRAINDQTVLISSKTAKNSKLSGGSIMTEDDSDSDAGTRKYTHQSLKSKKDPKELFK